MASQSKTTTSHDVIRKWIEERGGRPAVVRASGKEGQGSRLLRIDFSQGKPDERLEEVSWDEFFQTFEEKGLAFLFQDETSKGEKSRFSKFISRAS